MGLKKPAEAWVTVGASQRGSKRANNTVDAPDDADTYDADCYGDDWAALVPGGMDTTEFREVDIAVPELQKDNDLEMAEAEPIRPRRATENFNISQDPELEKLRALANASESGAKQLEDQMGRFQGWQATMDQKFTLLHASVENTQHQISQVVQAQVEMQAAMKTQTESITALLQAVQQQMATMSAKFDEI